MGITEDGVSDALGRMLTRPSHVVALVTAVAVCLWLALRHAAPARLGTMEYMTCVTLLIGALLQVWYSSGGGGEADQPVIQRLLRRVRVPGGAAWAALNTVWATTGKAWDVLTTRFRETFAMDISTTDGGAGIVRDALMPSLDRVVGLLHARPDSTKVKDPVVTVDTETHDLVTRRQYKQLSAWLCQLRATAPADYAQLVAVLEAAAAVSPAPLTRRPPSPSPPPLSKLPDGADRAAPDAATFTTPGLGEDGMDES